VSGIVYVIKHGLQWKDAPKDYGPHKTLYDRFIRWSRLGVFDRIFANLAGEGPKPERLMIDATRLKAHRTRRACAWQARKESSAIGSECALIAVMSLRQGSGHDVD